MIDPARLEKFYEWRQAQAASLGRGCFALAGLILSPLLAAVFNPDADVEGWHVLLFMEGAVLAAICGALWHVQASRLHATYRRIMFERALAEVNP